MRFRCLNSFQSLAFFGLAFSTALLSIGPAALAFKNGPIPPGWEYSELQSKGRCQWLIQTIGGIIAQSKHHHFTTDERGKIISALDIDATATARLARLAYFFQDSTKPTVDRPRDGAYFTVVSTGLGTIPVLKSLTNNLEFKVFRSWNPKELEDLRNPELSDPSSPLKPLNTKPMMGISTRFLGKTLSVDREINDFEAEGLWFLQDGIDPRPISMASISLFGHDAMEELAPKRTKILRDYLISLKKTGIKNIKIHERENIIKPMVLEVNYPEENGETATVYMALLPDSVDIVLVKQNARNREMQKKNLPYARLDALFEGIASYGASSQLEGRDFRFRELWNDSTSIPYHSHLPHWAERFIPLLK